MSNINRNPSDSPVSTVKHSIMGISSAAKPSPQTLERKTRFVFGADSVLFDEVPKSSSFNKINGA